MLVTSTSESIRTPVCPPTIYIDLNASQESSPTFVYLLNIDAFRYRHKKRKSNAFCNPIQRDFFLGILGYASR